MKVLGIVVVGKNKHISTLVTRWVVAVDSAETVHWLVNISHIVDEEPQSLRKSSSLVINLAHHFLVDVVVLIASFLVEPLDDTFDGTNDIFVLDNELWIVVDLSTLIKVWGIEEMPVVLIGTTLVFNVVSKASRLNEGIVVFVSLGVVVRVLGKDLFGSLEHSLVLLKKNVISDSGN